MQRIELRLIFLPELKEWRLYSGENYRQVSPSMLNLYSVIADSLTDVAKGLLVMSDDIRFSNPKFAQPEKSNNKCPQSPTTSTLRPKSFSLVNRALAKQAR